jgi:tRNA dimethylallyltransferase
MESVLLLGGPTASGKTQAALELALAFDGEIVGADSRQVYRGMPIGTAAPSAEQRLAAPHHLVSFLDPYERYSAAQYVRDALEAIHAIRARGRRAIVAGGTGFYLRALAGEVVLGGSGDANLRDRLAREATLHPAGVLHDWLRARDPARAAAIHPHDRYRVLRALELCFGAGDASPGASLRAKGVPFRYVWLDVPLEEIDRRIEERVDAMLGAGFVEEAERIGVRAPAATAVGYPLAVAWTRGWSTDAQLRAGLVRETRRYARRQRTWFRGERAARAAARGDLFAIARETFHGP